MVIPSEFEAARSVEKLVLDELSKHGYNDSDTFAVKLALEESLNNAIRHGNRGDAHKSIEIFYEVSPQRVDISITDEGPGFNPCCVPDPTTDENLEKPCGRGIMLMRFYMDEVAYEAGGSRVRMVKRKN